MVGQPEAFSSVHPESSRGDPLVSSGVTTGEIAFPAGGDCCGWITPFLLKVTTWYHFRGDCSGELRGFEFLGTPLGNTTYGGVGCIEPYRKERLLLPSVTC